VVKVVKVCGLQQTLVGKNSLQAIGVCGERGAHWGFLLVVGRESMDSEVVTCWQPFNRLNTTDLTATWVAATFA
jgi:hypothetical protein